MRGSYIPIGGIDGSEVPPGPNTDAVSEDPRKSSRSGRASTTEPRASHRRIRDNSLKHQTKTSLDHLQNPEKQVHDITAHNQPNDPAADSTPKPKDPKK
jgi:hypothetical protein